jgi:hypothetical protein
MLGAPPTPLCKCCGSTTELAGNLDFNKCCMDRYGARTFPVSEQLVPYWGCASCGFVFTDYMDGWSADDFRREIYNADYARADQPISCHSRPGMPGDQAPSGRAVPLLEHASYQNGLYIGSLLHGSQQQIRILDFGSGGDPGPTGLALIEQGFSVDSYEPYRANADIAPGAAYDVILAIEVVEHCHDLQWLARFMQAHLKPEGLLWIQTALHPFPSPADVLDSWYIAPRNGHISIFTLTALALLFRPVGINVAQLPLFTVGFKRLPRFPNQIFVS